MKKYIIALILGLLLTGGSNVFAEEKKEPATGNVSKQEEIILVFDVIGKFEELLKDEVAVAKDIKKYLEEHKTEFKKLKLDSLANLDEANIEKSRKALKKVMKEQMKRAVKLRKTFLKSKSGRTLYGKIQQIYQGLPNVWQIMQSFNQYQNMDKEEFNEAKEELMKEPQWSIEVSKEGEVEFSDELTSITYSVNAKGKVDQMDNGGVNVITIDGSLQSGNITPQSLGMTIKDLEDEDKKKLKLEGVIITKVKKDSKAEEAGFEKDDVITHLDGEPVKTKSAFAKALKEAAKEEMIAIKVKRGNKQVEIELELGQKGKGDVDGVMDAAPQAD